MRVNEIYNPTVFGDCQDGFGFQIKQVRLEKRTCLNSFAFLDISSINHMPRICVEFAESTAAAAPPPSGLATLPSVGAVP